jgi:hypothetical protein
MYALALSSYLMFDSLRLGQTDSLLVLAAACAWRFRDFSSGGAAVGAVIAMKLVAWPLLIWLLATRRIRSFASACASTAILLAGSWALIDFKGLTTYPQLLMADARAFETWANSFSVVKVLTWLGASESAGRWFAVLVAAAMAAIVVCVARERDLGWFTSALIFGLLASPILWLHYLQLLFVPLAIARRRSLPIWIVASYAFWLILIPLDRGGPSALAGVLVAFGLGVWAVRGSDQVGPSATSDSSFAEGRERPRQLAPV